MQTRSLAAAAVIWLVACGPLEAEDPPRVGEPARYEIRPTDGTGWNNNGYFSWLTIKHHDSPGGQFRLHYAEDSKHAVPSADKDADKVPDFVESFAKVFDEVYEAYIKQLGFRPPLDDSIYHDRPDYGGDGRFDVYLQDRGLSADGYVVVEACRQDYPFQCAGYMVVENDFVGYKYPTPLDGMKILASHEFFHVIQHGYRVNLTTNFSEATAVWASEKVYPAQKDYEKFLPHYFKQSERSMEYIGGHSNLFPYGLAVWAMFLDERYGTKVLRAIFEELSEKGTSTNDLDAIDKVLKRDHKSSLAAAFGEFALWNYFTGKQASTQFSGYEGAADYPQLAPETIKETLPHRIVDTIDHLSTRSYRMVVVKGTKVSVTVERTQPLLYTHLVTRAGDTVKTVSAAPSKTKLELESLGEVILIVASAARKGTSMPISLAIRGTPPPPDDPDPDDPASDSGCALTPGAVTPGAPAGAALLLLSLLPLLILSRRSRR